MANLISVPPKRMLKGFVLNPCMMSGEIALSELTTNLTMILFVVQLNKVSLRLVNWCFIHYLSRQATVAPRKNEVPSPGSFTDQIIPGLTKHFNKSFF